MKVLIYDSSKGFSRFLKNNLSKNYELVICNNNQYLTKYYDEYFDCAFINFNDIDDLKHLFVIFHQIKKIFVSTNLHDIKQNILLNDSIYLIELDENNSTLLNKINFQLEIIEKYQ
jgi:hypothetical protein